MKRRIQKKKGKIVSYKIQKKVDKNLVDVGKTSFILGICLAIVVGFFVGLWDVKIGLGIGVTYAIIFILGLVVGFLNITAKEVNEFLIASITLLVAASFNAYIIQLSLPRFGGMIFQVFFAIGVFVMPAATVVALKAIYELARKK